MNKTTSLLLSFACVLMTTITLVENWNAAQRWRFYLALLAFSLMTILFLVGLYVVVFRKKQ